MNRPSGSPGAAGPDSPAAAFGAAVLGPIVAEFCLRLWSLASLLDRRDDAALLFCARGGLRMQLAYERYLAATGLPAPVRAAPLMVSRVAAIRPALHRAIGDGALPPATASTLAYEFRAATLGEIVRSVVGRDPAGPADDPFTPQGLTALVRADPAIAVELADQAAYFDRHLDEVRAGAQHVVLVDTGLYGTTRAVLAEGRPDLTVSCALLARSQRPGLVTARTTGLSVEADGYSPVRPRTALLRYWHFVEWLFEPELPSVRRFTEDAGRVRSDLEIDGWRDRIAPAPGTAFAGVLAHLDTLADGAGGGAADRVVRDAPAAWRAMHRAVVAPTPWHVEALSVGARSHDFGTDRTWSPPTAGSAVAALRGSRTWREGEITASGSPLRLPLLGAVEAAHGARRLGRVLRGR